MSDATQGAIKRELGLEYVGINGIDPWLAHNSSPRKQMFATHVGQAPVIKGNEPRRNMTGIELELANYTFDIRFPVDAVILREGAIHPKFRVGGGINAIRRNSETTILYEDHDDRFKRVGVLKVPTFGSFHQDFGFRYHPRQEAMERALRPGSHIAKDTVLATSSAVKQNGLYGLGLETEATFLSMPGTIEDGFVVSRSFLDRIRPSSYHSYEANWGQKVFPLNLYGDHEHYKPFPDIGDKVRDDGLVFALRPYDPELAVVEMTPEALQTIDRNSDYLVYGSRGEVVVDVMVYHDTALDPSPTPTAMDEQARKYYDQLVRYYRGLLDRYKKLERERGKTLRITPELNQLIYEAQVFLPSNQKRKLTRMNRLDKLDEWRVKVTCERELDPTNGFKITGMDGSKGVICKILEPEEMPTDDYGNRAEVVAYGGARVKRMNMGGLIEQMVNAARRDLTHRLRKEAGFDPVVPPTEAQIQEAAKNEQLVDDQWQTHLRYTKIFLPLQHEMLLAHSNPTEYVKSVWRDGIYHYWPPNNPVDTLKAMGELRRSEFCPRRTPLTYRGPSGDWVRTKRPVLIGSIYMILLEKVAEDWSGVASVKTNHFGLLAQLNNHDKRSSPGRQQANRGLGESESRSFVANVGPWPTMELIDQSNNPEAHEAAVESIVRAPAPGNIERVVDRQRVPFAPRPVQFAQHVLGCQGMKFCYKPKDAKFRCNEPKCGCHKALSFSTQGSNQ